MMAMKAEGKGCEPLNEWVEERVWPGVVMRRLSSAVVFNCERDRSQSDDESDEDGVMSSPGAVLL